MTKTLKQIFDCKGMYTWMDYEIIMAVYVQYRPLQWYKG